MLYTCILVFNDKTVIEKSNALHVFNLLGDEDEPEPEDTSIWNVLHIVFANDVQALVTIEVHITCTVLLTASLTQSRAQSPLMQGEGLVVFS